MSGIIVGIVAIPLAIAFGISSGVGPTEGLVTAIIAGLIISVLGGSKVQIGGPTGAFIIILSGVNDHVHHQLMTGGIEQQMDPHNICANIHIALRRAEDLLAHGA